MKMLKSGNACTQEVGGPQDPVVLVLRLHDGSILVTQDSKASVAVVDLSACTGEGHGDRREISWLKQTLDPVFHPLVEQTSNFA
jgi:hypothetical protein